MPIVTLPGGELRDEVRQPLYDTIVLDAGASAAGIRRFFQSGVTSSGAPKSLAQTNLEQPGSLPTATSFRIQGLTVDSDNSEIANNPFLPLFARKSSVSLQVGVKNYWTSPLRFAAGRLLTNVDAASSYQQYGWPAIQPIVLQGKHVVDVNPLQNFVVVWSTAAQDLTAAEAALTVAAATDLVYVCSLKGLLRRPVQ